jgi:VanZ family protein
MMIKGLLECVRARRWIPALAWAAAIMAVSSLPRLGVRVPLFPGSDKVLHFAEYFVLGLALRYWAGGPRWRFLAGGLGFSALDEFHQRYVPGREASLGDLAADVLGLVAGFLVGARILGRGAEDQSTD